ncbi:MAG: phosphoribosylanthranilate isomerase [Lachnospiraceae bacterium]|nr:phosphoribosylanthranilate isomerase [Lachnospiraceae bacterium]
MYIKICGITDEIEADYCNAAMPDFVGFIQFVEKSKRNISTKKAVSIMKKIDPKIKKVAVTISPSNEQVHKLCEAGFDYIQIHGSVDLSLIENAKLPVLKAFNVKDMSDFSKYNKCGNIKGYVFDAASPGSGETFDWEILKKLPAISQDKILLLAGGLNPDNVYEAISKTHIPGVDVSSGVEKDEGAGKDSKKIQRFVNEARRADMGDK